MAEFERNFESQKQPEFPKDPLEIGREMTYKQVAEILKNAGERNIEAEIDGLNFPNPLEVYYRMEGVLNQINTVLGADSNDLYFTKFEGNVVGQAENGRVKVDLIMLLHPRSRLAHVIGHEFAHAPDKMEGIPNEGLVEAYLKAIGLADNEANKTERYDLALENFYEFVKRIKREKERDETVIEIYKLYYNDDYEGIFQLYKKRYIDELIGDNEKQKAYEFFRTVFPELECDGFGNEIPYPFTDEVLDLANVKAANSDVERKVNDTIEKVKRAA